jgi:hypothetical protein
MGNIIRCIKLSLHENILKELKLHVPEKNIMNNIVDELVIAIVDAFDKNDEGVIVVPKRKK